MHHGCDQRFVVQCPLISHRATLLPEFNCLFKGPVIAFEVRNVLATNSIYPKTYESPCLVGLFCGIQRVLDDLPHYLADGKLLNADVSWEGKPFIETLGPNCNLAIDLCCSGYDFNVCRRDMLAVLTSSLVVKRPRLIRMPVAASSGSIPKATSTWDGSGDPVEHAAPVEIATSADTASTRFSPSTPGIPKLRLPGTRWSMFPNISISGKSSLSSASRCCPSVASRLTSW